MASLTITATTTRAEIVAEMQRCSGYDVTGNVADARQFLICCRIILRMPEEASHGGRQASSMFRYNFEQIQKQLEQCQAWLMANDATYQAKASSGGGFTILGNPGGFDR